MVVFRRTDSVRRSLAKVRAQVGTTRVASFTAWSAVETNRIDPASAEAPGPTASETASATVRRQRSPRKTSGRGGTCAFAIDSAIHTISSIVPRPRGRKIAAEDSSRRRRSRPARSISRTTSETQRFGSPLPRRTPRLVPPASAAPRQAASMIPPEPPQTTRPPRRAISRPISTARS